MATCRSNITVTGLVLALTLLTVTEGAVVNRQLWRPRMFPGVVAPQFREFIPAKFFWWPRPFPFVTPFHPTKPLKDCTPSTGSGSHDVSSSAAPAPSKAPIAVSPASSKHAPSRKSVPESLAPHHHGAGYVTSHPDKSGNTVRAPAAAPAPAISKHGSSPAEASPVSYKLSPASQSPTNSPVPGSPKIGSTIGKPPCSSIPHKHHPGYPPLIYGRHW